MWIQSTGRIGGGGSHGDRTNTVAPRAERPGEARLTVPVPVARAASSEALREPPIQEIRIPALPEASDLREVPGMVREFATANPRSLWQWAEKIALSAFGTRSRTALNMARYSSGVA